MAKIPREQVTSKCLRGVGHDRKSKTLEVEFRKSGAVYRYSGVSTRAANNLKNAGSVGRYFVRNVRNKYDYLKVSGGSRRSRGRKKGRR